MQEPELHPFDADRPIPRATFSGFKPKKPNALDSFGSHPKDLLAALNGITAAVKENTEITREAWKAVLTGQQAEPPLNQGDFEQIDLCANDEEGAFIPPHERLRKLIPVIQERHLPQSEPVALICGGTIYHVGLQAKDINGIYALCRK